MALAEYLRKELSQSLKDGSTIYFSQRFKSAQVVTPRHEEALIIHRSRFSPCEITDIETAIDEAGLTKSTYNTDEKVTVLSVYKTRQKQESSETPSEEDSPITP